MGVRRPEWWCYPERCGNGHEWGPGLITVSWHLCDCPAAVAASGGRAPGASGGVLRPSGLPVGVVPAAVRAGGVTGRALGSFAVVRGTRAGRTPHARAAGGSPRLGHVSHMGAAGFLLPGRGMGVPGSDPVWDRPRHHP
jgi:hypothetical protein